MVSDSDGECPIRTYIFLPFDDACQVQIFLRCSFAGLINTNNYCRYCRAVGGKNERNRA